MCKKYQYFLDSNNNTKTKAKILREEQTKAENILWECLRAKRFNNLKFRRQVPFEFYILDFYCHEHSLVIELDGIHHENDQEQIDWDEERTRNLKTKGLKVIRFKNNEILKDLNKVKSQILNEIKDVN